MNAKYMTTKTLVHVCAVKLKVPEMLVHCPKLTPSRALLGIEFAPFCLDHGIDPPKRTHTLNEDAGFPQPPQKRAPLNTVSMHTFAIKNHGLGDVDTKNWDENGSNQPGIPSGSLWVKFVEQAPWLATWHHPGERSGAKEVEQDTTKESNANARGRLVLSNVNIADVQRGAGGRVHLD